MSFGAFTDKKHQPAEDEIYKTISPMLPAWQELVEYIRKNHPSDEDFKFMYGKNYGWARRFRIHGKLLTSLYPAEGGFTVQINLPPQAVELALQMGLSANVVTAIARAHPYPEGRWVFIPVGPDDDLRDIHQLLALRVETRRIR